MSIRSRILHHLAAGVDDAREAFDPETGRFLASNGGWAVTRQDVIFPLALLYLEPDSPHCGEEEILELALRGGDALRDWQDEEGRFEFIKTDGSRWGSIYMPWSIYHWLEAWALLRDRMDADRARSWKRGLTLAMDGLAGELEEPTSHNIPTWQGMSLVRGGRLFDNPGWEEVGRRQVLFSTDHQHPDGFWPEGEGPSTGYNLVYVHALGLYHAFTGDEAVLEALRRATGFHACFTYPDGSPVETVDGRQRYHGSPSTTGWPGFCLFPQGRRLVRRLLDALEQRDGGGLSARLASACQHLPEGEETPLPSEKDGRIVHGGSALVRRQGPWFACISGYAPDPQARPGLSRRRWIMTRSNCLSLWHDRLGLVLGGGNSKHDPPFATFEVWENGALRLEPDDVAFSHSGKVEAAAFDFDGIECVLRLRLEDHTAHIEFETPQNPHPTTAVRAGFTLLLAEGQTVAKGETEETLDPGRTVGFSFADDEPPEDRVLGGPGWQLQMPAGSSFSYPAYPFNPYAIDGSAPPGQALGSVSVGFADTTRRTFVLTVEGT